MTRSEFLSLMAAGAVARPAKAAKTMKLVLVAGKPSHPPGMHEFRAGALILEKRLKDIPGLEIERHDMGWVADESTLDDADALVIYSDGRQKHPAVQGDHLARIDGLIKRGMGFGCMHYGVEVDPAQAGPEFTNWLGGHYEHEYSCNPIWTPQFDNFPKHPVSRGVGPFGVSDEWYFNMRFHEGFSADGPAKVDGMTFVPILVAKPGDDVRDGPYVHPKGPYPHIQAAKGRKETMLWTVERPDGGRGFGFTGGHFHKNWQDDNYRKVVVNAMCWVAGLEVPKNGFETAKVGETEITQNLDDKSKG